MNIDKMIEGISQIDCGSSKDLKLILVDKKKDGITTFAVQMGKEARQGLKELGKSILESNICSLQQVEYNELGRTEDTIEVTTTKLADIKNVINQIEDVKNLNPEWNYMEIDRINYYVLEFRINKKWVKFFRRFNKQKKLRGSLKGYFTGNHFKVEDKEIIGFDNEVDLIIVDDEVLILQRYALQVIFSLKDYFIKQTKLAIVELKKGKKIENFQQFGDDCLNDGTIIKQMTKIVNDKDVIKDFHSNIDKMPEVIKKAQLKIKMTDKGTIQYCGERKERFEILSCIADRYYETLLKKEIGEDRLK